MPKSVPVSMSIQANGRSSYSSLCVVDASKARRERRAEEGLKRGTIRSGERIQLEAPEHPQSPFMMMVLFGLVLKNTKVL